MAKTGTLDQPFMFSTKEYDDETGLSYYGYRFYSPSLSRWTARDPIGETGGIGLYGFVGNNCVNFNDPLGLEIFMCTKPLDKLGGRGRKTGLDVYGNPLFHQYICLKGGRTTLCGGQTMKDYGGLRNWWPWGEGAPSNDHYDPDRCEDVGNNECLENCLKRELKNPDRPDYGLVGPGTNCQEWATDTFDRCMQECF